MKDFILKNITAISVAVCLLFFSLVVLIIDKNAISKNLTQEIDNSFQEENTNLLLQKSIELCKKEYSEEIAKAVLESSTKYNVPVYVIYAIIATESGEFSLYNIDTIMNVNKDAKSSYNCIGLMQVSKYALLDFNKYNGTNYILFDLYKINVNIEIGTWYYSQFNSVADTWIEQYIIYNVGYGEYSKVNKNSFFDSDSKWKSNYKNSYFYINGVKPPINSNKGMYGKNKLPKYFAKERFEKCLDVCKEYFNS